MKKRVMKKLLCLILAIAVFAVTIPFTAFAATPSEVNFAVFSDIHYFATSSTSSSYLTNFENFCKLNNSTSYLAPGLIDTLLQTYTVMAENGELDFVLLPGDLSRNAEVSAHQELANKLKNFETTTGVPVYVINGNHDINNDRAASFNGTEFVTAASCTPEQFRSIYAEFGYNEALAVYTPEAGNYEGYLSYTADLPGNYRLIAIDSQMYSADNTDSGLDEQETAGQISDRLAAWVIEQCEQAKRDGKTIIGMNHTNLVPHFDTEVDLFDNFVLRDWEMLCDKFADAGMNTVFTGHVHMQDVASYVTDSGNQILDITTDSLLNYPNQYRTVTMTTESNGKVTVDYESHDIDNMFPVYYNGVAQPSPLKNYTFGVNYGEGGIKSYVMNVLEYQLRYGFGKDVEEAGGLYYYLNDAIDFKGLITDLADSEILGTLGETAIRALLFSICAQVDNTYLQDIDYTLSVVDPLLDKLLSVEVSDYPCTVFEDTLGFGSTGDKGTLGDLASTVLAYHYQNNEEPANDRFLMSALERFYNCENAETIVDTLLEVVVDDLLQGTILKDIKIDPISFAINGESGEIFQSILDAVNDIIGADGWTGLGAGDIISVILMTGILGGDTLSDVVYSALDEYLTKSQYDIIDGEFYRIMKDLTHDTNPDECMDFDGTVVVTDKKPVVTTQDNLRLPSNIAVTFGEDTTSSVNISYFTKYSVTNTDIQIVPYSTNPDFSRGSTVNANVQTNCEAVTRSYSAIDLGFIGIISHDIHINRHTISITGLEKGTKYCYRIGDASRGWWSSTGIIQTADNSSALSFFHVSDPQSVTEKQYEENWAMLLETAFSKHDADFIISTGDMVDQGGDFKEWQRMFNSASDSLMSSALMTASGNHEEKGDNAAVDSFVYSNLPDQDTTTGVYYSFDYNTLHVAVLNTNDLNDDGTLSDEQLAWLNEDMALSIQPWKIVALHKAPYSNGSHIDDDDVVALREQLSTLMPELNIDLVLQGHDHVYMRTGVMNDNAVANTETQTLAYNGLTYTSKINPDGTIYSINGTAGSKHYEPKEESETTQYFPTAETVVSLDVPSYSYIQIDGGNLYFDSYSVENGVETRIDQFAISKVVTLPDGTVIDGTNGGNIIDNNMGGNVSGDINGTSFANRLVIYTSTILVAVIVTAGIATSLIMIKRRKEENIA